MRNRETATFIVGGLHKDGFEWACREFESIGYVLVAFEVDCDGYHWKATYAKADALDPPRGVRTTRLCLSRSLRQGERQP